MSTDISFNQVVLTHPVAHDEVTQRSGLPLPENFILAMELVGNNRCFEESPVNCNKERFARNWILLPVKDEASLQEWAITAGHGIDGSRCFRFQGGKTSQSYVSRWKNRYRNAYGFGGQLNLARELANSWVPIRLIGGADSDPCAGAKIILSALKSINGAVQSDEDASVYRVYIRPATWSYLAALVHSGGFSIHAPRSSIALPVRYEGITPKRRGDDAPTLQVTAKWEYMTPEELEAEKEKEALDQWDSMDLLNTPALPEADANPDAELSYKAVIHIWRYKLW